MATAVGGGVFRLKAEWEKRKLRRLLAWTVRLLLLLLGTPLLLVSYTVTFLLLELDRWATEAIAK